MDFPIKNKQVSTRLSDEELELLNEVILKLFPDQDFTDPTLTMRTLLVKIIETADLKLHKIGASKPEDLARIKQLETELKEGSEQNALLAEQNENLTGEIRLKAEKIKEFETRIQELEGLNDELTEQLSGISTEKNEVSEKVRTLEKYAPVPGEMRIIVDPLTLEVLNLYAEKIRTRQKVDITGGQILLTLFNRYVTKQETQLPGFPFLVSKQEIAELAKNLENAG